MRNYLVVFLLILSSTLLAQQPNIEIAKDSTSTQNEKPLNPFKTGFYPIGFFDIDLRYIIKYNNYEGIRLGFGGITNARLSEKYKIGGYVARGFKDEDFKYSIGGSLLLNKELKSWYSFYYTDDIAEIGQYKYLTDARVYSVFEPRLVNITQFFKHKTFQTNIQHEFTPKFMAEVRLSHSRINQIINYAFLNDGVSYDKYQLAEATASVRISPKTNFFTTEDGTIEYFDGFPKISAQITQGLKGFAGSDFEYAKFGLKLDYYIKRTNLSSTNILLEGDYARGNVPLTHLFHAYPNSPTKDEILQRFSVAGRSSFETMYFGEFFSEKLATLKVKHSLRRFYFSKIFQPELVLISKHAIGTLDDSSVHLGTTFNTLEQVYNEAGLEINKLFFGFGLSFAYRYGHYTLPDIEDNISFKFTFYLKL